MSSVSTFWARSVKVKDGDTVQACRARLIFFKESFDIRLYMIDTYELKDSSPAKKKKAFEAKEALEKLVNRRFSLPILVKVSDKTDRYGRHIGFIYYWSWRELRYKNWTKTAIKEGYSDTKSRWHYSNLDKKDRHQELDMVIMSG